MNWPTADRDGPRRAALILEPEASGHQREWLEHLVRSAGDLGDAFDLCFAVAPELHQALAALVPPSLRDHVRVIPLQPSEQRLCSHRSLAVSGFYRWLVMRRYLRSTGSEAGHFLSIDLLSLPLALGLGAGGRRLSGILFRPSVHYPTLGPYARSLRERLRDWRKAVLYRLMLRNPAVDTVLTLDPYFVDYARRRYRQGMKVHAAPDPAYPMASRADGDAVTEHLPKDRTVMILFGFITARKGALNLLDALLLLSQEVARRSAIIMAGRIDAGIRDSILARASDVAQHRPELSLLIADRWLASGEIGSLIGSSDVVLAPYQRFVGSSGVLMWASRAGKPILAPEFGLIGRLVADHRLGLTLDTGNPRSIADAITRMVQEGARRFIDAQSAQAFADARTPERFAAAVFASLDGEAIKARRGQDLGSSLGHEPAPT